MTVLIISVTRHEMQSIKLSEPYSAEAAIETKPGRMFGRTLYNAVVPSSTYSMLGIGL